MKRPVYIYIYIYIYVCVCVCVCMHLMAQIINTCNNSNLMSDSCNAMPSFTLPSIVSFYIQVSALCFILTDKVIRPLRVLGPYGAAVWA
jgi:hypothetical protein